MCKLHIIILLLFYISGYKSHGVFQDTTLNENIQKKGSVLDYQDVYNNQEDNEDASEIQSEDIEEKLANTHNVSEVQDVIPSINIGQISENTRVSNSHGEGKGYERHIALPGGWPAGVYEQPASGMGQVLESVHKERGGAPTHQLENKNDAEINPRLNETDGYIEIVNSQPPTNTEYNNTSGYHLNGFLDEIGGTRLNISTNINYTDTSVSNSSVIANVNYYNDTLPVPKVLPLIVISDEHDISHYTSQTVRQSEIKYSDKINNFEIGEEITQRIMADVTDAIPQYDTDSSKTASTPILSTETENIKEENIDSIESIEKSSINVLGVYESSLFDNTTNEQHIGLENTFDKTFQYRMSQSLEPSKTTSPYSFHITYFNFESESLDEAPVKRVNIANKTLTKRTKDMVSPDTLTEDNSAVAMFTTDTTTTHTDVDKRHWITSTLKSETTISPERVQPRTENDEDIPNAERLILFNSDEDTEDGKNTEHLNNTPLNNFIPPLHDYKDQHHDSNNTIQAYYKNFMNENIKPGLLFEDCSDCDLQQLPIRPAEQRGNPKKEVEHIPSSNIMFAELPEGRKLKILSLGLSDGIFLFNYLSEFLSWIQPNEFPVELLRDALKTKDSWFSIITESVQVEVGFVACLVAGVVLALAVPLVVLSHACYRMGGQGADHEDEPGWGGNCKRRTLVFVLQILLILLFGGMVAMLVTNEQLSGAVLQSSDVLQTALDDVSSFVHNAHLQLHFLVTQSVDQVLQAIYADLDNVDSLLGRPIQQELVSETGLDVALDSLGDLTRGAKQTTEQVERFLDEARVTQEMAVAARDKLADLRQQVELFRRACGPRDRTLCDAIDATGLEITLRLDRIKTDDRLNMMRRIGSVALEVAAREAKEHYLSVPSRVEADTKDTREAVRRQLTRQRAEIDESSRALDQFARQLTTRVSDLKYDLGSWMQHVDEFEYWRWIACMGGGVAVLMVWSLLLSSLCCGCCGSEKAAGPTILVSVVLVCLFSTVLWSMVLAGLLVGGHGEVFVCRPLYDEPEYRVVTDLLDRPGVLYTGARGGFISNVLYGNDTLDVPIKQVLQDCQDNRGVYPSLGLQRVFDVEAGVAEGRWGGVSQLMRAVRANLTGLQLLSPALQDGLVDFLTTLAVNFTEHRIQLSKPVTGKDLDSFARQLDNIGNQMRDLATASRMETLSTRTRRLIDSHVRPLEGKKDSLVYQLTALEVQTVPLQRQVNQSLSHLKTIQFFVNSQGEAIAQRKSREYADRLAGYVDQLREHVLDAVTASVAPCRPLWEIFNSTRLFLCRHTMDPLNGFWFATMWCLLVLLVATPVCLKLVDYYRAHSARASGSPTENLMIAEQGAGWSSPGNEAAEATNENW